MAVLVRCPYIFFFNDTATTEIYTLSLHDALPISSSGLAWVVNAYLIAFGGLLLLAGRLGDLIGGKRRSEEHTSELQSRLHLVCRLLLEKKKNTADDTRGPRLQATSQTDAVVHDAE